MEQKITIRLPDEHWHYSVDVDSYGRLHRNRLRCIDSPYATVAYALASRGFYFDASTRWIMHLCEDGSQGTVAHLHSLLTATFQQWLNRNCAIVYRTVGGTMTEWKAGELDDSGIAELLPRWPSGRICGIELL